MSNASAPEPGNYVPGGRLPPRVAGGKTYKEVNFPNNATVVHSARGDTYTITTSPFGALCFPGGSCTNPNCNCGHEPWPTAGVELDLRPCNVICEICGLLRSDFRTSASNLRRHVRDKHVCEEGTRPDSVNGKLYKSVKASRTQKPRKKRAKADDGEEQEDVDDDVDDDDDAGEVSVAPMNNRSSHTLTTTSGIFANPYAQQYEQTSFSQHPSGSFLSSRGFPSGDGFSYAASNVHYSGYSGGISSSDAFARARYDNMSANSLGGGYGGGFSGHRGDMLGHGGSNLGRGRSSTPFANISGGLPQGRGLGGTSFSAQQSHSHFFHGRGRGTAPSVRKFSNLPDNADDDDDHEEGELFVHQR